MTGITLSSEQIRGAPPEVRRWIEHEVATSLGFQGLATGSPRHPAQLAGCSPEELAAVLARIQGAFPVVNVFFELGRKGASFAQDRLQGHRLSDIQHHTRLQGPEQVIACLDLIDESFHRVRGSNDASLYGIEGDYCFVAMETQQNIRRLWLELIDRRETDAPRSDTVMEAREPGAAISIPSASHGPPM